jgi:hypothetical protein
MAEVGSIKNVSMLTNISAHEKYIYLLILVIGRNLSRVIDSMNTGFNIFIRSISIFAIFESLTFIHFHQPVFLSHHHYFLHFDFYCRKLSFAIYCCHH